MLTSESSRPQSLRAPDADGVAGPPLLIFDRVGFHYPGRRHEWILQETSLRLFPGDRLCVVGDNGSGKTSLARLALGLYKPQRGTVQLFSRSPVWADHYPALGFIGDPSYFAGGLALPPEVHAHQLIEAFEGVFAASPERRLHTRHLKTALGLDQPRFRKPIGGLSKGMRFRLLFFLALAKKPRLLLADEATEGLDRESRQLILAEVSRTAREEGMAVLWITHRFEEAAYLQCRVGELREGKLRDWNHTLYDVSLRLNDGALRQVTLSASAVLNEIGNYLGAPTSCDHLDVELRRVRT